MPVEEANALLRQQIARQEFSAEDVERHAAERRRVKDALINARDAKTNARKVPLTFEVVVVPCGGRYFICLCSFGGILI